MGFVRGEGEEYLRLRKGGSREISR